MLKNSSDRPSPQPWPTPICKLRGVDSITPQISGAMTILALTYGFTPVLKVEGFSSPIVRGTVFGFMQPENSSLWLFPNPLGLSLILRLKNPPIMAPPVKIPISSYLISSSYLSCNAFHLATVSSEKLLYVFILIANSNHYLSRWASILAGACEGCRSLNLMVEIQAEWPVRERSRNYQYFCISL